jgi:hypothetical protein
MATETRQRPFFRLRAGESTPDYIKRMRYAYGRDWFTVPICIAGQCDRVPTVRLSGTKTSMPVYYCAKHAHRIEEWRPLCPSVAAEPFACPPRQPTRRW